PHDVLVGNGSAPDDVVVGIDRAPHDVVVGVNGAPDHVLAIRAAAVGAPHDVLVDAGAPHDVVARVAGTRRAPDDVLVDGGAPDDVVARVIAALRAPDDVLGGGRLDRPPDDAGSPCVGERIDVAGAEKMVAPDDLAAPDFLHRHVRARLVG